jgi:hypothetical protein
MFTIKIKRTLALALTVALLLGALPLTAAASNPAESLSFGSASVGAVNDGVDFQSLVYHQIYMGTYDHATAFLNNKEKASDSTIGEPEREGVARPILWRVAGEEADDGKLTLLSEYVLDSHQFHSKANITGVDYATSDLRQWLNGEFLSKSFSPLETAALAAADVVVEAYKYTGGEKVVNGAYPKTLNGDKVYLFTPLAGWAAKNTDNPDYTLANYTISWEFTNSGNIYSHNDRTYATQDEALRHLLYYNWSSLRSGIEATGVYYDEAGALKGQATSDGVFSLTLWARAAAADNSTHAPRVDLIGSGNNPKSLFGIQPIVKLNPANVLYASEIAVNPDIYQTNADGENYITGEHPLSFGWKKDLTNIGEENGRYAVGYGEDVSSDEIKTYKLTVLNSDIKLDALTRNGVALNSGGNTPIVPGDSVTLSAIASGHSRIAYKIVKAENGKRIIVGYGTGSANSVSVSAKDFDGNNFEADGDYTLYVWAQKDNSINSNEGSAPMTIKLNAGDTPSSWAADKIKAADKLGLLTSETNRGYQYVTTRAEFCRLAVNFLRQYGYAVDGVTPKMFSDTPDRDIGIAAALEITSGTDTANNLFSPDSQLTREQAATMLRNVMNVIGKNTAPPPGVLWTDEKDISDWAKAAADVMYRANIMGGTSTTALTFSPKSPYTHEQAIVTIMNLWEYVE